MIQPKRFIVDATDECPEGDYIYYTQFQELEAKYNFMVSSAQQNAKERDSALEKLEITITALESLDRLTQFAGKVPTGDQWVKFYCSQAPQKIRDLLNKIKEEK